MSPCFNDLPLQITLSAYINNKEEPGRSRAAVYWLEIDRKEEALASSQSTKSRAVHLPR